MMSGRELILNVGRYMLHVLMLFLWLTISAYGSENTKIIGQEIIRESKEYKNIDLDLTEGHFYVEDGATLSIKECNITVKISMKNNMGIFVKNGKLFLKDNKVNVIAEDIVQTPDLPPIFILLRVRDGGVDISGNNFTVNAHYSVGLFATGDEVPTSDFTIHDNTIENFHGGFYLVGTNHSVIYNNVFLRVSAGNIFLMGDNITVANNTFLMPGNLALGDAIDIVNAENIRVYHNFIMNDSCHAMQILGSRKVTIDGNYILNSITHAFNIAPFGATTIAGQKFFQALFTRVYHNKPFKTRNSESIYITNNYLSQNRFGITANNVKTLHVKRNIFIQKFKDANARKFWTNNNVLITNTENFVWRENQYKEAFSQDINDDNRLAKQLVPFPEKGGVVL